jgi:2-amino-4-hydroxy-6-hydroxymethyldihydropteridine diphosphokinase
VTSPRSEFSLEIAFSLGSNLGDRVANLAEAKRQILDDPHARLAAQSALYETEPVDVNPAYQHLKFVNAVLIIDSSWPAEPWLARLSAIEQRMHRERSSDRNAPRTIDIDILYAGETCIDSGGLVVPHPRWAGRRFVVEPLAEVRPDLILPGVQQTVAEIFQNLPHSNETCGRMNHTW